MKNLHIIKRLSILNSATKSPCDKIGSSKTCPFTSKRPFDFICGMKRPRSTRSFCNNELLIYNHSIQPVNLTCIHVAADFFDCKIWCTCINNVRKRSFNSYVPSLILNSQEIYFQRLHRWKTNFGNSSSQIRSQMIKSVSQACIKLWIASAAFLDKWCWKLKTILFTWKRIKTRIKDLSRQVFFREF